MHKQCFPCLERDFLFISSNIGKGGDADVLITTQDAELNKSKTHAFPNPFTEYANTEVTANLTTNNQNIRVQTLTTDGKLPKQ